MVAGKKECLKVSVVQMGSFSDFELLIRVFFFVLRCRCVSRYSYQAINFRCKVSRCNRQSEFTLLHFLIFH